jgi:glutathione S-transferase
MLILYGTNGSPFVSRVRMQVYAKELPVEIRPAELGSPEFYRMNPLRKMPVLEHNGLIIPESAVILEYIEDAFPTPSLLGGSVEERMRARLLVRTVDLYCGGLLELLRAAADPNHKIDVPAKRADMDKGLDALETFLKGDRFAAMDKLSIADCALVPWLFYGKMLSQQGDDMLSRRPKLARYISSMDEHEIANRIWGEMDEAFRAFMARWKASQENTKS